MKWKLNDFRNVILDSDIVIADYVSMLTEVRNSKIVIGKNVHIAERVLLDYSGGLVIKNDVTISREVIIYTHDHGVNPRAEPRVKPLIIEDGVWIGARAIILQGVDRIGKNSVIAANSIVTKNVSDNSIIAGIPARKIKEK